MNIRRLACPAVAAAALTATMLGGGVQASAAQRFAAPAGTGPAATCPQNDPCDLDTAVENAAVGDNDEVIVTPGTYSITTLEVTDAIDLHGQASQPPPTINASGSPGIGILDAATVRDLKIEAASFEAVRLSSAGATVERVSAHAAGGGATACSVFNSVTIRDTLCWGSGTNSKGVGANLSTFAGNYTVRLRNVTAAGTTYGLGFDYSGTGVDFAIDAKNVIADGGSPSPLADVRAAPSLGASTEVTLANSNYATEFESTNGGGISATVTNPGTGTNQTAAPSFVNAGVGDFHQQAGSPTIDAGVLDGFTGTADFEGDARTLDGDGVCPIAPDIGADERTGAPIDCDPPDTTINGGPSGPTSDPTPTFDLVSNEPNSTFECRIDNGSFSPCATPFTTPPLGDGSHTLEVRATDQSANVDPSPASRTFSVDTDPPETTITGGPAGPTADTTPTFDLGADEPSSTFECRIDAGAYAACVGPYTTAELADGDHQLQVRAIDPAGNPDPTPASRTFSVDTAAPETTITDAPKRKVKTKRKRARVTLEFTAEEGSSFECSLDGRPFKACTSPVTRKLRKGRHTWAVRAVDEVGNADPTPDETSFRVKRKRARRAG